MFNSARLRLTGWYLLILAIIVGVLSVALYELVLVAQRAELTSLQIGARNSIAHVFAHDEPILAFQIVALDAGILVLAAAGAYLLAGRTLRPIEEIMERQRRFAGAASHELRTPLTALQSNLEVARLSRRTPEEYEEMLHDAIKDTARMSELVRDLVVLARPDNDATLLNQVPLDLRDIASAALEDVCPLARAKNQTLEADLESPLSVCGDALKLRQVLVNLLENAVMYTSEGGRIRLTGRSQHGRAVIEVRDTGQGIALKHLPHLFEPFYQADTARSNADHVGLGLALAAWIVRAHRGQIDVASQLGVGTVFTVSLPLTRSERT